MTGPAEYASAGLARASEQGPLKRVCFITTVSSTLDAFFLQAAEFLCDRGGFDVTLVCDDDPEFASRIPSKLGYLPVPMQRGVGMAGIRSIIQLVRIFRRERFDLVQYATPNAGLYASIASRIARVPVRLYCQCGLRYVTEASLMRSLLKEAERLTCRLSTHVRVASPGNRAIGMREGLYAPEKSYVLGHGGTVGVELSEFPLEQKSLHRERVRASLGIGDSFVFGFVGRLTRDKGVIELFRAFERLAPKSDCRLLCVGSDEMLNDGGEASYRWARLADAVLFAGSVEKEDLHGYYAAIDCLVLPTHREGFGMVLQEAGAMACPIITTDVPGASEVMEDGVSCVLVPARDDEALEAAMARVMGDEELRERLGRNARSRVEMHFERSSMLERQYVDYCRLLEGASR
jgi:glycosyltransferase involved in cell wall biosynthesis